MATTPPIDDINKSEQQPQRTISHRRMGLNRNGLLVAAIATVMVQSMTRAAASQATPTEPISPVDNSGYLNNREGFTVAKRFSQKALPKTYGPQPHRSHGRGRGR